MHKYTYNLLRDIPGCWAFKVHSGDYEDYCFQGSDVMQFDFFFFLDRQKSFAET